MSLAIMLTLQATAIAPIAFDLATASAPQPSPQPSPAGCGASPSGEIVVCGRAAAPDAYRAKPLANADRFERRPLLAETGIAKGVTAGVRASSVVFPGGIVSNRVMVTLKTKF